nr:MAG TPA: hypothetical protein [Caudoviricetes sp.]
MKFGGFKYFSYFCTRQVAIDTRRHRFIVAFNR